MSQPYSVSVDEREVVVRFRRDMVEADTVLRLLDYLELEALRRRSQLTQEDAEALADEIDQKGLKRLKESFAQ